MIRKKHYADGILDTHEMLLLLLWRHLEYYANPQSMDNPLQQATSVMRLPAIPNQNEFREEVKKRLNPLLQRISSLEFVSSSIHILLSLDS